jgi:hypothetical protein
MVQVTAPTEQVNNTWLSVDSRRVAMVCRLDRTHEVRTCWLRGLYREFIFNGWKYKICVLSRTKPNLIPRVQMLVLVGSAALEGTEKEMSLGPK